ncbi:MAG TPA: hypothetical protein VN700_19435 [Vicinamibacterales bacterium]|nr:hypothetical protein [Vicinamibacterales bacterium]
MSRSTRNFLIGAATVGLLCLGTGLVAFYNGAMPGSGQASDADLAYLPANAAAVGYADVRTIMASQLTQKIRQMLPTGEEKEKLQAELGVDIEKDIDSVAVAYIGSSASPLDGALVVVRGRFNTGQIEALATQHGATASDYSGRRLLLMPTGHEVHGVGAEAVEHNRQAGIAFLEQGAIAFGEEATLKAAIDGATTGNDIRKNTALMAVVNDVRSSGNAWFVGKFDALTGNAIPDAVRDHIPPVDTFAVSLHVNGGLRGAVRADARDDKAAEQLRDVVRGAIAAGKLMSGQNKDVDTMLNSLQISGSGKTVGVSFSLPAEFLDVLNGIAAARGLTEGSLTAPGTKKH